LTSDQLFQATTLPTWLECNLLSHGSSTLLPLTITTPFWIDNDQVVLVELTCDQAGDTGVIDLLGTIANYTLRI